MKIILMLKWGLILTVLVVMFLWSDQVILLSILLVLLIMLDDGWKERQRKRAEKDHETLAIKYRDLVESVLEDDRVSSQDDVVKVVSDRKQEVVVCQDLMSSMKASGMENLASIENVSKRLVKVERSFSSNMDDVAHLLESGKNFALINQEVIRRFLEISASSQTAKKEVVGACDVSKKLKEDGDKSYKLQGDILVLVKAFIEAFNRVTPLFALISDISKQTDLLSLNATIEAAKSKEVNGGFTLVAREIKHLSETTKETVKKIHQEMEKVFVISRKVEEAMGLMNVSMDEQLESVQVANKVLSALAINLSMIVDELESVEERLTMSEAINTKMVAGMETLKTVLVRDARELECVNEHLKSQLLNYRAFGDTLQESKKGA